MRTPLHFAAAAGAVALLIPGVFAQEGEREQSAAFGDLPAAVQQAFTAEVPSPEAAEYSSETEHGQTTYEAEWVAEGFEHSIEVDAAGALIEREQESLAHQQGDDDDASPEAESHEGHEHGQTPGGGCDCSGTHQAECTCTGTAQATCACHH